MAVQGRFPEWVRFAVWGIVPWIVIGALVALFRGQGDGPLTDRIARYAVIFGSLALVDAVVSGVLLSRVSRNHRIG